MNTNVKKCNKNFGNKKSNYLTHINKKNPCKINNNQHQIAAQIQQNAASTNKINNDNDDNKNKFLCKYCNYCFTRVSSLKIHLKDRCKMMLKIIIKLMN